ncbi:hypothetical protein BNJ_00339 [Kaumoebavirus]|uniref:hypothetical protein n=1 Tax=Kaumoebavirus TaxID=1859492 RepID=UPI0009C211AF|nr:hypothetical protein BNJ_00339 [Kaumoebavirus]ARA72159.1 hypothetical protein BNJ_00339 [Kaumoebavirus]
MKNSNGKIAKMLRATTFRKIPEQLCNVEIVLKDGSYMTNALVLREVEWFRKRLFDIEVGERRRISLIKFTLAAFEEYHKFLQKRKLPGKTDKRAVVLRIHSDLGGKELGSERRHRVEEDECLFEMEL